MKVEHLQPDTVRTEADIVSTKKQTDAMEEQQQGGPLARAAQPLPLYNVGLNYAGVSIKHVTFYQDFIV